MVREATILRSEPAVIQAWVLDRYGFDITAEEAEKVAIGGPVPNGRSPGWSNDPSACSSGYLVWAEARLRELGYCQGAAIRGEYSPVFNVHVRDGQGPELLVRFSRSRLKPELNQIVFPINLTTLRVVGDWY